MKLTKFFLTFLFAAIAVAGFSQRGLQPFTDLKTGTSITYNRDNIVRAYPTTQGTKLWFNSGNPTDVSDGFSDVISDDPGGLIQFMYVNKSGTLKFIALNPDYIVKAYGFNSDAQTVAIMRDGNTFLIDTAYASFVSITYTVLAQSTSPYFFADASDTTYFKIPVGAQSITIQAWGAGGGGGSGRRGAAGAARGGGSGGGSGAYSTVTLSVSTLSANDSLAILVGAGGAGGAAVSANTTNGNDGVDGGTTRVWVLGSSTQTILSAGGGSKGVGGSNASVAGGAGGTIGDFLGKAGGAGDTTGVAGTASVNIVAGGGGGGGGVGVTNVNRAGGGGGAGWYSLRSGGTGGVGGAQGTAPNISDGVALVGGGGSGAGGGGFAGRNGTAGAGGGGGSASANGTNSGAGGTGGGGVVVITANY